MTREYNPARTGRFKASGEVTTGSMGRSSHTRAEVDIDVTGASDEREEVVALFEELEAVVEETINEHLGESEGDD